jgi:hypothetical protein
MIVLAAALLFAVAAAADTACFSNADCPNPGDRCDTLTNTCSPYPECTTRCFSQYGCFVNDTCDAGHCYHKQDPFPGCCHADADCAPIPCMIGLCYKPAGLCMYLDLQNDDCASTGYCPDGTTCVGDGHAFGSCVQDSQLSVGFTRRQCANHSNCGEFGIYPRVAGCADPEGRQMRPGMIGLCYTSSNWPNFLQVPYAWEDMRCNLTCESSDDCPRQFSSDPFDSYSAMLTQRAYCLSGDCVYNHTESAGEIDFSCNTTEDCEAVAAGFLAPPCPRYRCANTSIVAVPFCWVDTADCALCTDSSDCDEECTACYPAGEYGYCVDLVECEGGSSLGEGGSTADDNRTVAVAVVSTVGGLFFLACVGLLVTLLRGRRPGKMYRE